MIFGASQLTVGRAGIQRSIRRRAVVQTDETSVGSWTLLTDMETLVLGWPLSYKALPTRKAASEASGTQGRWIEIAAGCSRLSWRHNLNPCSKSYIVRLLLCAVLMKIELELDRHALCASLARIVCDACGAIVSSHAALRVHCTSRQSRCSPCGRHETSMFHN